jgi:outer membrane protein assembly factor BamB
MTQGNNDFFQSKDIDELIDELGNISETGSHQITHDSAHISQTDEQQLVQDLYTMSTEDAQLLAQIRFQLANLYTHEKHSEHQAEGGIPMAQPVPSYRSSILYSRNERFKRQPSGHQGLVRLLSTLVAVLVIGSMIAIFMLSGWHAKPTQTTHHPTSLPTRSTSTNDYYAILGDSDLVRIDAKTNTVRWKYHVVTTTTKAGDTPPFILEGDTIYVIGSDTVYAINVQNGKLRSQYHYTQNTHGTVLVDENRFYVMSQSTTDPSVTVYNLSDGSFIQTYHMPLHGSIQNSVIYNHVLYLTDRLSLLAWRLSDGHLLWHKQLMSGSADWFFNLQITDNTVYIGLASNMYTLLALNATTGARVGEITSPTIMFSTFVAINNVVYYELGHTFYACNIQTGQELWQRSANPMVSSVSAIDGSTVIYENSSPDHNTYIDIIGLDARTGALKWHYYNPQPISIYDMLITLFDEHSGQTTSGRVAFLLLRRDDSVPGFTDAYLITASGKFIQLTLS